MPKSKEIIHDPRQTTITSFFPIGKGPLKIKCGPIITSAENKELLKKYRSKNKKQNILPKKLDDFENDEYIKTEKLEMRETNEIEYNCEPLIPNIILRTDLGYTKYISSKENASTKDSWESEVYETSPPKIQKTQSTVGKVTLTKSRIKTKDTHKKMSKTLQMSQSNNVSDYKKMESNLNESHTPIVLSETTDITNLLEVEFVEDNENIHQITNHIELVNEIIENTTKTYLSNLLFDDEKTVLEKYQKLTIYQKYFSCKLFTHQVKWYNAYKFKDNIHLPLSTEQINCFLEGLADASIIKQDYSSEEVVSQLNFLNVNEVKCIHDALRLKTKQTKKPELIESILNYVNNQLTLHPTINLEKTVRQMISDRLGKMVHISPLFYTAFYKVHLLYTFTNPEFDIPSGLYLRMNKIKYGDIVHPNCTRKNETVFDYAEDYANFYKAFSYKNEVIQALEKKGDAKFAIMFDLSKEIVNEFANVLANTDGSDLNNKPSHLKRFTAGHQYASAIWLLCKHLGCKFPHEVREWLEMLIGQTHFYQKKRGLWYSQLSLVYNAHLNEGDKAVETLIYGLKDQQISFVDRSEIVYRSRSYCKRKKLPTEELLHHLSFWNDSIPESKTLPSISIKALANSSSEKARQGNYQYMTSNGDTIYMNVEEIAIRHYRDHEGFNEGEHCEGALMQTLFYILFWDIIFTSDIPYTFICKMQYLPLDFHSPEFYLNRKTDIDKRLSDIKLNWSPEYFTTYLYQTWNIASECKSFILSGLIRNEETLFNIITCIGRNVVSDICERLVQNFRDHRAGMPDLFVYNEDMCKFVEVKGPGDQLSSKQKLWINFLLKIGANAEVCYVTKIGSNRRKMT